MSGINIKGSVKQDGYPVLGGLAPTMFGRKTYYVDPASGSNNNTGKEPEKSFASITKAFSVLGNWDTIYCAPGNHSGNHTTPLNATASFVRLIGVNAGEMGTAPWAAPSNTANPIIDVRARGWRISGLEFEGMTGSSAIRLNKIAGLTQRCDFTQIDNCLFSGGKMGVEFNGGGTYWIIKDNHFSLLTTAGGAGIYVTDSSYQVPALGYISRNRFDNNINHIDVNGKGFNDVVIEGNHFPQDGNGQNATILIDILGGGGNAVIGNYFDIAAAEFNAGGTQRIFSSATDYGAGNWFQDGAQAATMRQ